MALRLAALTAAVALASSSFSGTCSCSCSAFVHPNLSHGVSFSRHHDHSGNGRNDNNSNHNIHTHRSMLMLGMKYVDLCSNKNDGNNNVYNMIGRGGSKNVLDGSSVTFTWSLCSSFYNDFEDFDNGDKDDDNDENDDDDDDDGDDDYIDFDDAAIAKFRSKMGGDIDVDVDSDSDNNTEEQTPNSNPDISMDDEDDDMDDEDDEIYDVSTESSSSIPQSDLSSISSVEDLISFATSTSTSDSPSSKNDEPPTDWAVPIDTSQGLGSALDTGVVLVANPAKFCADFPTSDPPTLGAGRRTPDRPSAALLTKFGLTLPPPPELGPDRRADLLPVLLLLERHPLRGCQALLLNRRTGYLIGDLDQQQQQQQQLQADDEEESAAALPPSLGAFMIQPLWFGGTSSGGEPMGGRGFDMVHLCPNIDGAKKITEDGLYWGGDPAQAQETMGDPGNGAGRLLTGFDFKFFVQSTRWLPTQLEKEIRDGTWILASVSKDVLFKSRDRLGTKRAKPLWTEVMESMGGEYQDIRDLLYGDE